MSVAEKTKPTIIQPNKMGLLVENPVYKPFRYPWCYDAWLTQQRIHWLPEEVPLGDDVRDWQKNLSVEEKNLLTHIFRFFTLVSNYIFTRFFIFFVNRISVFKIYNLRIVMLAVEYWPVTILLSIKVC